MKILQRLKSSLILFIITVLFFINVIPSFAANLKYTYDDLNRLEKVEHLDTGTGYIEEYEYDEVGNRTYKVVTYSNSYVVTFDSQNADVAAIPKIKVVTPPATTVDALPTPPIKAGSTFAGWFTEVSGGGTQFTASTTVTENITVRAYWVTNPVYTVTYNSQGGTDVADQHVTAPATTVGTLPTNPTRTGYTFGGWYTEEEGGGTQFTATTTVTEDITVYAKWDSYSGPVSIGGTSYATLQAAYVAANNGDTIKVKAVNITENINVNRDIWVNIEGGYDDNYSSIIGNTTLQGMIQTFAGGGTLTIKNFILQRGSYDILATAGVNGSITPSGLTNVVTGNNQTFTITPYSGYSVHAVLVDGDSVGAVPSSEFSYEFSNVATEHTIHAIFNCKITATAGSNGSITPSGTTSVGYGGSQIYTITPDSGYIVQDVLVDGISVGDGTVYPFNNVTNDHTISVSFTPLTKLLLHMDGTNGSTTFIDSSPGAKTITPHGNAQLSTAQKKFGTASGLFDGDSDWVTAPSSTDWSFGTGNFTVDFWLRKNTSFDSNYRGLCGQYVDSNNYWYFRYKPGTLGIAFFYFKVVEGGVVKADYSTSGLSMSTNTWYHIELVRNGTAIYIFVNGVARSITANTAISTKSMPVFSVLFDVGASHSNGLTFKGYLDEFRVSNGIARHTANFTPPTAPY